MIKRMHTLGLSLCGLLLMCPPALADNWPQWRGPTFNGAADEKGLPDKLDPEKNVVWKTVMPGHSSGTPAVFEDRIFVSASDVASQKLLALRVDAKTGNIVWQREVGQGTVNQRNNAAAPSPITDGKTAFFYYGTGDLAAFDMDGKQLWTRNIQADHGQFNIKWMYASSPLLYNGKLFIQVVSGDAVGGRGGRGGAGSPAGSSYLLVIDPANGKDLFKVPRPSTARSESKEAYSSPIPYESGGRKQVLVVGADCLTAHDAENGAEVWRFEGWNPQSQGAWRVVASPVVMDGRILFCTPQAASRVIAVKAGGEAPAAREWENTQVKSDVPAPLAYQGNFYVLDGDFRKGLNCLDPATGQTKWTTPITSSPVFRSSPTGADGKIYVMNEQAEVWVLSASDGKILSNTTLATEGFSRASIVAAGGKIYVRTGSTLYCFGPMP